MKPYRLALAALLLAACAMAAPFGVVQGRPLAQAQPEHAPPAAAAPATPQHGTPAAAPQHEAAAGHDGADAAHDPGWMPTVWKAANFLILVGALVYFLREPVMAYLHGRIAKVREDLVTAKQTRETAARQLAEIDAKLAALPAELEALKVRGAEDLAAERARIEEEAQAERQRVLEHTRREIDMRLRVAKRELLELGANLAVDVAAATIKKTITADDQTRLVDRYAAQLQTGAGPGEVRQ